MINVKNEINNENDKRTNQDFFFNNNFNFENDQLSYVNNYYENQNVNFIIIDNLSLLKHCYKNC